MNLWKKILMFCLAFTMMMSSMNTLSVIAESEIVNLAARKTITASSSYNGSYNPTKAIDGDATTNSSRWISHYKGSSYTSGNREEWIMLDLKYVSEVSSVNIVWENACASSYTIQGSLDGIEFFNIKDASGVVGLQTVSFDPVQTRYLRLALHTPKMVQYGYCIFEIEVMGKVVEEGYISPVYNVALNKGVYTNPNDNKKGFLTDGNNALKYETDNNLLKNQYLDLTFGADMKTDAEGYNYNDNHYIIVDLGKTYLMDSFVIYDFERQLGERDYVYTLSVSNDEIDDLANQASANWYEVGSKPRGTTIYKMDYDLSRKQLVRYIKFDRLACPGVLSFSISEAEAYGMEIDDIQAVKDYVINEINTYENDVTLNDEEASAKAQVVSEVIDEINNAATVEEAVNTLNAGLDEVDEVIVVAQARKAAKEDIQSYKNLDNIYTDDDRTAQLAALNQAILDIDACTSIEAVEAIVKEYKALVDSFNVMIVYEIIPSPHRIEYSNQYYPYSNDINVVCAEGSLDQVTVNYIKEIYGTNVSFATTKAEDKLNLYLTSDDKDDEVETWIRNTYGDKVNAETLAKNEAHVIFADVHGISIIGNDDEGLFRGLTTLKFIKEQMEANDNRYRGFIINDYADMAFRGLIEGYYGFPWSWSEKADLLQFGSDYKMNKIVYAPKNDPYHTTKWKDLYPSVEADSENNIDNVTIAAQTARKYKADLVWTAHCFGYTDGAIAGENGIRYNAGDENIEGSDINLLKAKFQQLYDAGVRTFGLLLDDCDYGPRTLNDPWPNIYNPNEALTDEVLAETTAIVNIMAQWCKDKGDCYDLIFCPASYNLGWMKNGYARFYKQAYQYQEVSYYDVHFEDNVQIITTGTSTFSNTNQSIADRFKTEGVSSATGYADGEERRDPLMWTNYPTVDAGNTLDFGPQYNLETNLDPEDFYGLMSNPFQWAQMNKTVIPSICQYTWNLKDFDAEEVYENQMKYVMDNEELADAMLIFTNHNDLRDFSKGEGSVALRTAINNFKASITEENAEKVLVEINKVVDAMEVLKTEEKYENTAMYDQLLPYTSALQDLATSIQNYMLMFEEGSNVIALGLESDALYARHSTYKVPDVGGGTKIAATATKTLLPFAQWLNENQRTIMVTADSEAEDEIILREALHTYLDNQLSALGTKEYYYDAWEVVIKALQAKKVAIDDMNREELPTVETLTAEVETLLASLEGKQPLKSADKLVTSFDLTVTSLENPTSYPASNIIDNNLNTSCSILLRAEEKPQVVIDLGTVQTLGEIWVRTYVGNARYHIYDMYTSVDGDNYTLLENRDLTGYADVNVGTWFNANGIQARYILLDAKDVIIGAQSHGFFHVSEMDVYLGDPINYEALEAAITSAEGLNKENYVDFSAVEEALKEAKAYLTATTVAIQDDIDAATTKLNAAMQALSLKPADYADVNKAIEEANAIKDLVVDFSGVQAAIDAVVAGKTIDEQVVVDSYAQAIRDAMKEVTYIIRKVQNVKAEVVDYKTIQLSWDAFENAQSYVVERMNTQTNKWIKVTSVSTPTATITGVKTGKEYTYRVSANYLKDETLLTSEASESVKAKTSLTGTLNVELENVGTTKFKLTWNEIAGATRYIVYRKSATTEYKKIVTLNASAREYVSSSMLANTYSYVVKAARYDGTERIFGPTSNEAVGIATNEAIELNVEDSTAQSVTLTWNAVEGMSYYEVYRVIGDSENYRRMKVTKESNYSDTSLKAQTTYKYKVRAYRTYNDQKVYTPCSNVVEYTLQ